MRWALNKGEMRDAMTATQKIGAPKILFLSFIHNTFRVFSFFASVKVGKNKSKSKVYMG